MIRKRITFIALGIALAVAGLAQAEAILTHTSGKVKIGVDDLAQLNIAGGVPSATIGGGTTNVGVRYLPGGAGTPEYEVTSHGCLCEGWGVSYDGTTSGYANNSTGILGLAGGGAVSADGVSVTVQTVAGLLSVTHEFKPSANDNLYEVVVTIEAAADVTDVRYRRTMDWDADPTPFDEYVTIQGTAAATAVLGASNDGFCVSDPLSPLQCGGVNFPTLGDFMDLGPDDHGANFDFGFGALGMEESLTFSIFYGGADNVDHALQIMSDVGIEVYSLGRSGLDGDGDGFADSSGALTPTYIFGFKGVGGDPVPPPRVPEPATVTLFGLGLLAIGLGRKRR